MTNGQLQEIIEAVQEELKPNGSFANNLFEMLNIDIDDVATVKDFYKFIIDLKDKVPDMIQRVEG